MDTETEDCVFVRSVTSCYKQDSWSSELVIEQSPAVKTVSMEAEDSVGIRHQATNGEDTVDLEDLLRAVLNCRLCVN
jgi:hypothetical protein